MMAVQNSQVSNTRLWSSFEIILSIKNIIVTEIISSQRIIYINIHTYSKQSK